MSTFDPFATITAAQNLMIEAAEKAHREAEEAERVLQAEIGAKLYNVLRWFNLVQPGTAITENKYTIDDIEFCLIHRGTYSANDAFLHLYKSAEGERAFFILGMSRPLPADLQDEKREAYDNCVYASTNVQQQLVDGDWTRVHADLASQIDMLNVQYEITCDRIRKAQQAAESQPAQKVVSGEALELLEAFMAFIRLVSRNQFESLL